MSYVLLGVTIVISQLIYYTITAGVQYFLIKRKVDAYNKQIDSLLEGMLKSNYDEDEFSLEKPRKPYLN